MRRLNERHLNSKYLSAIFKDSPFIHIDKQNPASSICMAIGCNDLSLDPTQTVSLSSRVCFPDQGGVIAILYKV
jgi:hypothetical protein